MYSLRAFARSLNLSPGLLSDILARKRPLTLKTGLRIATRLDCSLELRNEFIHRVQKSRIDTTAVGSGIDRQQSYVPISEDSFDLISEWYHNAILSLMLTSSFKSDPQWIAARLGISTIQARDAIARLIRVGLAIERGGLLTGSSNTTTTTDVPSEAIRKSHRQHMKLAIESLDEVDVSERDVTSISMSTDARKIAVAKEMIKKFRRELAAELESGKCDEVYCLNIQLFPLTKKGVH